MQYLIRAWLMVLVVVTPVAAPLMNTIVGTYDEEAGDTSRCRSCGHQFRCHNQGSWDTYCMVYGCGCSEYVPPPIITRPSVAAIAAVNETMTDGCEIPPEMGCHPPRPTS